MPAPGTRLLLDDDVAVGINAIRHSPSPCLQASEERPKASPPASSKPSAESSMETSCSWTPRNKNSHWPQATTWTGSSPPMTASPGTTPTSQRVHRRRLVLGLRHDGNVIKTESIVLRSSSATIRRFTATHLAEKWLPTANRPSPKMEHQYTPEPYSRTKGCLL